MSGDSFAPFRAAERSPVLMAIPAPKTAAVPAMIVAMVSCGLYYVCVL